MEFKKITYYIKIQHRSLTLYCDHLGAAYFAVNLFFYIWTKHVEIDFHFIWELVASKALQISLILTIQQLVDILKKPLPKVQFIYLWSKLCIYHMLNLKGSEEKSQLTNEGNGIHQ